MKLIFLLVVVTMILCFEVFVRLFIVSPVAVVFDPELGAMKAPFSHILRTYEGYGDYTSDQYGFNNNALPQYIPKLMPQHRFLVLGDSFVEAKHVPREKNFVARLNALPDVSAYNAGYSGADPRSFPVLVPRFLSIIKPTQLILCVNADDLTSLNSTTLPTYTSPTGVKAWLQPLFAHSALATHLNWKYKPVFQAWLAKWSVKTKKEHSVVIKQDYHRYKQRWSTILDKLDAYHIPMLLVVLPSVRYGDGLVKHILDVRAEILASVALQKEIKVVRTEQAFIQDFLQTNQVGFGFMNSHLGTGHLNVHGHAIVTKVIAKGLALAP